MVVDIAEQRLIRRAPLHPLPLGRDDQDYITRTFLGVERVFGVKARLRCRRNDARPCADAPAPGTAPQPQSRDRRSDSSYGRLSSAIMLVDVACVMDAGPQKGGRR